MKISYNKSHTDLNGNKFEFRFNGEISDGIVIDDKIAPDTIESIIDDFINNHPLSDMITNVAGLRTILRNYKEKLLVISYESDNIYETVKYDNGDLFLFEKSEKIQNQKYTAKYSPLSGNSNIEFKYDVSENDVTDYPYSKNITELMKDVLNHIYQLKQAKTIELDKYSKTLIEIYKLFYNENPNFHNKDINIRMQAMMLILVQFNLTLESIDDFNYRATPEMPTSSNIEYIVNKLYPFGEISYVHEPVMLFEKTKRKIKIVGETIRENLKNSEEEKNNALITISNILCLYIYDLPSNSDIRDLAEFIDRPIYEVESSIQLIKKIETRIGNETN